MGAASTFETHSSRPRDVSAGIERSSWMAREQNLAAPLLLSAVALVLVLLATPYGLGVSPDSTQYLSVAQHLRHGEGLQVHWWDEGSQPLTHFPPGLAAALAALGSIGLTPDTSARLLNTIALVAIGLLSFALARKATGGSLVAGIAGAGAVVVARDVLTAHAMIWSEPLFLALMLGALLVATRALESDRLAPVVGSAVLTGLAGLMRYAVPALIGAIALSLLVLGTAPIRRRIQRSIVYAGISAAPLILLFAFNATRSAVATDRQLAFHPPEMLELNAALRTAYYWIVPMDAPGWVEIVVLVAISLALCAFGLSFIRSGRSDAPVPAPEERTRTLLALFGLCYVAFLGATLALFDAQSIPGARLLLPVVPVLSILVVAMLNDSLRVPARRTATIALAYALGLGITASAANWVAVSRREGLGYSAPAWRNSPLIAAVRELGPGTVVYTNHPGVILFQTGREVPGVPRLANPNSRQPNADYAAQMSSICRRAGQQRVAYVHFSRDSEWFLPSLVEVRERWHSSPRAITTDGVLDTVPAGCPGLVVDGSRADRRR
jgi:hypothetical protein